MLFLPPVQRYLGLGDLPFRILRLWLSAIVVSSDPEIPIETQRGRSSVLEQASVDPEVVQLGTYRGLAVECCHVA